MSYYYVIIAVLIVFKIIFWSFFCYVRNRRYSAAQACQQRAIIVERVPTRRVIDNRDRATIVDNEVVPEPSFATAPPSYADALSDKTSKPPSYDLVVPRSN
ncbi:hypothetical protein LOTGIDRAFT_229791 [Lottia gigantea]|uniref:Uncharacterized protein n=1 Tax=Lottia gigantea TaxID=225164 RepID=V3ZPI9_LOTGI|nr:hypothetical protein LOTGIDRAFT_229791 [Lottia gigantea]ESO82766.1 hypothetical protein LOTGIDRAFT_229791 [Lottia gigantea]